MEMWEDFYEWGGTGEDYYEWGGMAEGRGGTARDKGFCPPPPPPNLLGVGAGPLFLLLCTLKLKYKLLQIHVYGNFVISGSKFEK